MTSHADGNSNSTIIGNNNNNNNNNNDIRSSLSSAPPSSSHDEYRQILVTANRLEIIQTKLESVIDLFVTPIVSNLYRKLCKDCLKLLFDCEFKLDQFRKAEELIWKRVYHDIYRFLKTKRQLVRKQDEYLIESHFLSGIGFYSSLIIRLRIHYNIHDVPGTIAPLNMALMPIDNIIDDGLYDDGKSERGEEDDGNGDEDEHRDAGGRIDNSMSHGNDTKNITRLETTARQWACMAIYRSLIYMGDLARYLLEFSDCDHRELAFNLYRSASRYQSDYGLPFNQLATLATSLNYNLDAVCNYMRCCSRPKPFERAEGNMEKIFEFISKFYEDMVSNRPQIIKASDVLASKDPVSDAEMIMRSAIVTFIKLTSDLWSAIKSENADGEIQTKIVNGTKLFFEILREAIELEAIVPFSNTCNIEQNFCPISGSSTNPGKPRYVSTTIMYEFCSISIMLIARCQKIGSTKNPKNNEISDLVNTLALNLLHYATSKCHRMVLNTVQGLRISRQDLSGLDRNFLNKPSPDLSLRNAGCSSPISSDAASRRVLSRLRQKKAASKYSDGVARYRPLVVQNEDSDLSELEETALSTIDALEISSEMSDDADYQVDDLINLDSGSDDGAMIKSSVERVLSRPVLRPTRSQNYERERKRSLTTNSCSSLPVADLLTGDISFQTAATSRDASGPSSDVGSERHISSQMSVIESTLAYVYNQTHLPTIKIYFDWILSNGAIIDSNMDSFSGFHAELLNIVDLLNELVRLIEMNEVEFSKDSIFMHIYNGPEWSQKYPLSCDFPFVNLNPLKSVHESNIDFSLDRDLNDSECGFITIQCVIAFAHALTIFLKNKTSNLEE